MESIFLQEFQELNEKSDYSSDNNGPEYEPKLKVNGVAKFVTPSQ